MNEFNLEKGQRIVILDKREYLDFIEYKKSKADSNIIPNQYILLDENTSSIISIDKYHHNNTWHKMHELLNQDNSFMPTISDMVLVSRLLKENKARYADGSLIKEEEQRRIFNDIYEVRDPGRAEYLDADFKIINGILNINYNHRYNNNVLTPQNTETLDINTLMKNKLPGISLESWLDNPTSQGFPRENVKKGDFYYYAPLKDNNSVVWFIANSDRSGLICYGNPQYSGSALGVRSKKFSSENK